MAVLRDYIKVKHGFAFKGDHISTEDNGIVLVTPGNFSIGGGFKEEKCKFFDGEYPSDYVLKPDDLIVTMTDLSKAVDTLGYSALVPNGKRIYLHNQRIGLVQIIDDASIDKHFLYWFMRTPCYQKTIAATSSHLFYYLHISYHLSILKSLLFFSVRLHLSAQKLSRCVYDFDSV